MGPTDMEGQWSHVILYKASEASARVLKPVHYGYRGTTGPIFSEIFSFTAYMSVKWAFFHIYSLFYVMHQILTDTFGCKGNYS